MVTISKPLTAGQALNYHEREFKDSQQAYYTQDHRIDGEWQGKLAQEWGLAGSVTNEQFDRLAHGQHPVTGEQLVQYRTPYEYIDKDGERIQAMEHRAAWDATFSAPKSVSLTALVGSDERVRAAHTESVKIALTEMEQYVQARMGGNNPAETTGKWVVATFEHDSARPVDGYSAPQLHTHAVFFNVTETSNGQTRALQTEELFRTQAYATAVYRSELADRLKELGYQIEVGKYGEPQIKGYTEEYLKASSERREQITTKLEELGVQGAAAAQIAAHQTRSSKEAAISPEETLARHQEVAAQYGNQAERVVAEAHQRLLGREDHLSPGPSRELAAHQAVTYAKDKAMERDATVDERHFLRDALNRSLGNATIQEIKTDYGARKDDGEFIEVAVRPGHAGHILTTQETLDAERDIIRRMEDGRGKTHPMLAQEQIERMQESWSHLNENQRAAVEQVLSNRDQVMGVQGYAGVGKTTSLAAIREGAEHAGFEVKGLAPTSRAAHQLQEAGIESATLQGHLARGDHSANGLQHLYFVDESSLASTKQVNEFLQRLGAEDRVIFVGDMRQHQGVEAGKPFEQLQGAGMETAKLEEIVRQHDPQLKAVVEKLARGEVRSAIEDLRELGKVHEIRDPESRIGAIAQDYADSPAGTLVVSPDNKSRSEINGRIHHELQDRGLVNAEEHKVNVLAPRQDLTGADRQWAGMYHVGDVLRYSRGSGLLSVEAGEYTRVVNTDSEHNFLTVVRADGQELTYDPQRLQGVNVYREEERTFSVGDRVQFTSPNREQSVANRELGTIENLRPDGQIDVRLDSGRNVQLSREEHLHLDYGYAVTSHSGQGTTADRVLVHVDSSEAHHDLINTRLAYVAVSRAREDAQLYTNDADNLGRELSRDVSKSSALEEYERGSNRLTDETAERFLPVEHSPSHEISRGEARE